MVTEADAEADAEDIRRSLTGDGEAYARLVRRYQQPIARSMWRFTRDARCAEELVQDVFVEAYLSLRTFRGQAPFLHWLRAIATRVGYREWKRRGRERQHLLYSPEALEQAVAGDAGLPPEQAGELLHSLLGQLPARDRLVLHLMYLEECTVAETARLTGWSESMVKVQSFRARRKLRRLLEQAREGGADV